LFSAEERKQNTESEDSWSARSFLGNATLLGVISENENILHLTVLGSELFVVRYMSLLVYVYNTNNFTLTRTIAVPGSLILRAIVASPRYNCLYISVMINCRSFTDITSQTMSSPTGPWVSIVPDCL